MRKIAKHVEIKLSSWMLDDDGSLVRGKTSQLDCRLGKLKMNQQPQLIYLDQRILSELGEGGGEHA